MATRRVIRFSLDGQRIAIGGSGTNDICVFNTTTGALDRVLSVENNTVYSLGFSFDGTALLASFLGTNASTRAWRTDNWTQSWEIVHASQLGRYMDVSRISNHFVVSASGGVSVHDSLTGAQIVASIGHEAGIVAMKHSADGSKILTGSRTGRAILWDEHGSFLQSFWNGSFGPASNVNDVAISPSGDRIAIGDETGNVYVCDALSGALLRTFSAGDNVTGIAFALDGQRIIAFGAALASIWRLSDGLLLRRLDAMQDVQSLAIARNAPLLATGSSSGIVRIWNYDDGRLIVAIATGTSVVRAVSFSHDSTLVVTVDSSPGAKVWSTIDGGLVQTFQVNDADFRGASFGPHGRIVTATSLWAPVWRVGSEEPVHEYMHETFQARHVSFSPNGRSITYGRGDGVIVTVRNPFHAGRVDVNGDGCVDDADVSMVLARFGSSGTDLPEDIDQNGFVDDADLSIVLTNFGLGC